MAEDLIEQLNLFLSKVEGRLPTLEQKKAITKAGAKVYREILQKNTPKSLHHVQKHTVKSLKQATDSLTGNSSVFFSTKKGEKGHIARFLNDGYMSHGGKGKSTHTVKFIQGTHFVEQSYIEAQDDIFLSMQNKYFEEINDDR
ncbi:HK97 gp10 family phage protein [Lactococcus garvieae]|uniref:Bacteriophage HK97-gp10, putative tail-component n=1 Tax=Lactococcus garvieae TaxID=1363 RepID=A0A1I4I4T1_9LACT|nr:HK97 gp10 family phage protein [Lactococcus garvieae]SFL49309.1 Bacteriophage HK97-gp10, putative tail-component [Lactococcus garvieae]